MNLPAPTPPRRSMDPWKPNDPEWNARYQKHLASYEWKRLRERVIERENGICQGCREEPIEHVHHLSYQRLGNEFLFELMGLCCGCHLRVHDVQEFKQGMK